MNDKEKFDKCVEGARELSTEELLKPLPTDDGGEFYRITRETIAFVLVERNVTQG